jgi:hypothetical protein
VAADIVNLRKARKAKARGEAESRAAENRIRFGRTKAERAAKDGEDALQLRRLEGHRLAEQTHAGEDAPSQPRPADDVSSPEDPA